MLADRQKKKLIASVCNFSNTLKKVGIKILKLWANFVMASKFNNEERRCSDIHTEPNDTSPVF